MKKLVLLSIFCLLASASLFAQNPVKWTFSAKKVKKGEYKLLFDAEIQAGWAIYSQNIAEGGPVPTSFEFTANPAFSRVGDVTESSEHKIEGIDEIFDMQIIKYKEKVQFTQIVKVTATTKITGKVTFMSCDSESCLPPRDVEFSVDVKK